MPTVDDYFTAASALATLVREAIDHPGSVTRKQIREVLEAFERVDSEAKIAANA